MSVCDPVCVCVCVCESESANSCIKSPSRSLFIHRILFIAFIIILVAILLDSASPYRPGVVGTGSAGVLGWFVVQKKISSQSLFIHRIVFVAFIIILVAIFIRIEQQHALRLIIVVISALFLATLASLAASFALSRRVALVIIVFIIIVILIRVTALNLLVYCIDIDAVITRI